MRMSLSVKAMLPDPFETIKDKFSIGNEYEVKIVKLTDFGAFAEMEEGIVGLIHSSEIKHMQKNVNPKSVFKIGDVVKVKLKEVDTEKRKIGLSYKDCLPNPVDEFITKYPIGTTVKTKVVTKKDFGIFCNTGDSNIDIFVHYKQLDYAESSKALDNFNKGDEVELKIIDIKDDKVNGSIRALKKDPFSFFDDKKIGDIVSTRVVEVQDNGLKVDVGPDRYQTIIRKSELALEKSDQRPNRFSSGDSIDAAILELDAEKRRVKLSVKKLEQQQADEAIEKYGSTSSGQSLAGILGEALEKKDQKKD
jgi:small subunit ribosomal protein S1